ncbi:Uncharacterised protein [Mycobacterium tuberculosis]|uniref:Uncharacterized protein n=1 Tax=Mycobacterium tuberculosis TaxID=1773 RepID=A0A654U0G9_MYCTX|nr:Uncharacterised protein [Mycobacterium tuberculosis]CFS38496.1 Uncharacterised protein [Mycobacterium tuberculosis]CKS04922.1 Uncharacterised protein [Mycobacterium tuberculosis]COW25537.1 Uncharacterised protein [Mycobacterium tuberculosis]COW57071.1 Uncharacterised protein [Mycobacterium tuberculosis]
MRSRSTDDNRRITDAQFTGPVCHGNSHTVGLSFTLFDDVHQRAVHHGRIGLVVQLGHFVAVVVVTHGTHEDDGAALGRSRYRVEHFIDAQRLIGEPAVDIGAPGNLRYERHRVAIVENR